MKYLKRFNEEFDAGGYESHWSKFEQWISEKDLDLYDGIEDLHNKFIEVAKSDELSVEEKAEEIAHYLEDKWGLYDGYEETLAFLDTLFMDEDEDKKLYPTKTLQEKHFKTFERYNNFEQYKDMFDNIGYDETGLIVGNCNICNNIKGRNGNGVDVMEHAKQHESTSKMFPKKENEICKICQKNPVME